MMFPKRGLILLLVGVFLLFSSVVSGEVSGCYTFGGASEDLYCVSGVSQSAAEQDCVGRAGCDVGEHFTAGSDCRQIQECKAVICSVDCQERSLGKCEQMGGQEVPEEAIDLWCSPGCCKIAKANFCQFGLNKYQCEDRAQKRLGNFVSQDVIFDNPPSMTPAQCNQLYCQVNVLPATLRGTVLSLHNEPLAGVSIHIEGLDASISSSATGEFSFVDLNPGSYFITASKDGFIPSSISLSIAPGEVKLHTFILTEAQGVAGISGTVRDATGQGLSGATIAYRGPMQGQVQSGPEGTFEKTDLAAGEYTVIVSKVGYSSVTQAVTLVDRVLPLNVVLQRARVQGVSGTVYFDSNADGLVIGDDPIFGARVFVDGIFRGFSLFEPAGTFEFEVSEGRHNLTATFEDLRSEAVEFEVISGRSATGKIVLLQEEDGECSVIGTEKSVEELIVTQVQGVAALELFWERPCAEVIEYKIIRISDEGEQEIPISPVQGRYVDYEVEWGESYSYQIIAFYDQGREAAVTASALVAVGDEHCEGRYHDNGQGWETFCLAGTLEERKNVWSCDVHNRLVVSLSCGERDLPPQENNFCAMISLGQAECKNAGACLMQSDPFGLYAVREACYGTDSPESFAAANFCYYDQSTTIVNQCLSCSLVSNCFDYKSSDACRVNNCLSDACQWINGADNLQPVLNYQNINLPAVVNLETGAGYCVPEHYTKDDQCGLCSPDANLFENFYCTAQVCSGLGRCYADAQLSSCEACGKEPTREHTCYSYNTALECVGEDGHGLTFDQYGQAQASQDQCGWERCLWNGVPDQFSQGSCVKDSDGDAIDDCTGFRRTGGEFASCTMDNSPPKTLIFDAPVRGASVLSLVRTNLTFEGNDEFNVAATARNKMKEFYYCLTGLESDSCIIAPGVDFSERFALVLYPGKLTTETVSVDVISSSYLNQVRTADGGETYRLKFFSIDKYFNRESVKEAFVFIDTAPPEFEVDSSSVTMADLTDLTVFLKGPKEPMSCDFALTQRYPQGGTVTEHVGEDVATKDVVFRELSGIRYNLTVSCVDVNGNINSKQKEFVFDLDQTITIVRPALGEIVAQVNIPFEIQTSVGASCGLYVGEDNTRVADFEADEEGKHHQTLPVAGFVESSVGADYKVVCQELLSQTQHEEFFDFTIDFTAPSTTIELTEGGRVVRPLGYGWREFFVASATANFECLAEGFACEGIKYCLGEGCEFVQNPNYQDFSEPVLVSESTQICYYATDVGHSEVFQPECGEILIEGYGITLEKPDAYRYRGDIIGVSNTPTFDWQFSTKVPTAQCRFDFEQGFEFNVVPVHQTRDPNEFEKYLFSSFPESVFSSYPTEGAVKEVYLLCTNFEAEIGPEQKMLLEYDPSAPQITDAYADPSQVLEEISTNLIAVTDDKTLCRYSDDSIGNGAADYDTMEFPFPGVLELDLLEEHQAIYTIPSVGDSGQKAFVMNVMCQNGAGEESELSQIQFNVDYTQQGYILESSLRPSGIITTPEVTLQLATSKNARCEYKIGDVYTLFDSGEGLREHTALLTHLADGEHLIPVRCSMADHVAQGRIEFTIDRTPPTISLVEDGNLTCGSDSVALRVYTDETALGSFEYEVHDLGERVFETPRRPLFNASSSNRSRSVENATQSNSIRRGAVGGISTPIMVLSATVSAQSPIIIPTVSLNDSHAYKYRVRATDAVGNVGTFVESDGMVVTSVNNSICLSDIQNPVVSFANNNSCSGSFAEMYCEDETGCLRVNYGISSSDRDCLTNRSYSGGRISYTRTSWLCYSAQDMVGNNASGLYKLSFTDKDGDGRLDTCDECNATGAGRVVDAIGCADNQVPEHIRSSDQDADGLPDYWEDLYDDESCEFKNNESDSDGNGILDNLDDYDDDGLNNLAEFSGQTNPCTRDELPEGLGNGSRQGIQDRNNILRNESLSESDGLGLGEEGYGAGLDDSSNLVAWIFLVVGLLCVLGGTIYLVEFYKRGGKGSGGANQRPVSGSEYGSSSSTVPESRGSTFVDNIKNSLFGLRKQHEVKQKERSRQGLFSEFNSNQAGQQHLVKVDQILNKKTSTLPKINELAQHYVSHKETIAPVLGREEKGVFGKLERIAQASKNKKIGDVVSTQEAKDIFSTLRDLSSKRKSGKGGRS